MSQLVFFSVFTEGSRRQAFYAHYERATIPFQIQVVGVFLLAKVELLPESNSWYHKAEKKMKFCIIREWSLSLMLRILQVAFLFQNYLVAIYWLFPATILFFSELFYKSLKWKFCFRKLKYN